MQKGLLFFGCGLIWFGFNSLAYAEDVPAGETAPVEQKADDSASNSEETERVGGLNEEQLRQLAIASEAKPNEVVWLEVTYPEQADVHQVLALEQRPRSPLSQAQGAVLILHDKEQHADWPYLIHPLRMTLPDSGWYTLTVNLPYDEIRNIPERELAAKQVDELIMTADMRMSIQEATAKKLQPTDETEGAEVKPEEAEGETPDDAQAGEPEIAEQGAEQNEESVDIDLADKAKPKLSYRERALAHVKAAMEHINTKGYRNIIVIGYRAGADIMLEYVKPLATSIGKQGFGLVMVDPKLQLGYQTDLASALGQNFRAPVLDVINGSDLDGRVDAAEREAGARIASANLYRQIRLTANESGAFQQTLIRRVRSWLEKYAPGMQAKKFSAQR